VNLVLCVLWREKDKGPLHVLNIHNFCTDKDTQSADAYFVADVMDFHLQTKSDTHPGTFDAFTKIYLTGDHGPHFSSAQTANNESTFYEKYGKKVESHFLCSYHAVNRCNGAGVKEPYRRLFTQGHSAARCLSMSTVLPIPLNKSIETSPSFLMVWLSLANAPSH
jgi:hypothetical protein